jgi:hypothetical protein
MADTRRNLEQLLKGEQLYGVYTEVLHDLTATLREKPAKKERSQTTITAFPPIV